MAKCLEQLTLSLELEASAMVSKDSVEDLKPLHLSSKTNSVKKFSENTGPTYQSTMTSEHSQQMDLEELTFCAEASPASLGARREKEKDIRIRSTVISGLRWLGLFKSYNLDGCVARMSEDLLTSRWASPGHSLTWTVSDINQHIGFCLQLQSEHRIGETECGLLHMPTATANQMAPSRRGRDRGSWWPTPTASDHKGSGPTIMRKDGTSRLNARLDYATEQRNPEGGQLNPQWVEWLMGFPIGWTDLKPSETQLSRKSSHKSAKQS